jgi:hypothetical protein
MEAPARLADPLGQVRGLDPAWSAGIMPSWVSIAYILRPPQRSLAWPLSMRPTSTDSYWKDYLDLDETAASAVAGWAVKTLAEAVVISAQPG